MQNQKEEVQNIPVGLIDDPVNPMRSELDREALFELSANIKQNGLINPITVRPVGDRFEVVAGHRRLFACKIAGLLKLVCVVRELSDEQVFEVMTAENLERVDVPLLDECRHYKIAIERFGKTVAEIAKAARRSVGYIESRLAIAEMPDYLQNYLQSGEMKLGVALALNQITNEDQRCVWASLAVRDGASVRQAEYWLYQWRMDQLPTGVVEGQSLPNAPQGEYVPPLFVCAIDGKKYPVQDTTMVTVYKGNLQYLNELREQLGREQGTDELPPQ